MLGTTKWRKQMWATLKMVAPGTLLREGIENVLRAKTGGLIVLCDDPKVREIVEGGFTINEEMNPSRLYELAKMDGAIILDEKGKTIWKANVQLNPTVDTSVQETGIRHRIAARTAIQTDAIVIAISQRRSMLTLYKGEDRFVIADPAGLMAKANQALRTLERYCAEQQEDFANLSDLEFEDSVLVNDVVKVVQRSEMMKRISEELDFYLLQMGNEGALVEIQKEEMTVDAMEEYHDLLADYAPKDDKRSVTALERKITELGDTDLLDNITLARTLGFGSGNEVLDMAVMPRGYRILGKVPRLPQPIVANIIDHFNSDFRNLRDATVESLDEVEGVGRVRSNMIFRSFERQKDLASGILGRRNDLRL
jgi:diadenylate cyclase